MKGRLIKHKKGFFVQYLDEFKQVKELPLDITDSEYLKVNEKWMIGQYKSVIFEHIDLMDEKGIEYAKLIKK
jgi:hypothetical protein